MGWKRLTAYEKDRLLEMLAFIIGLVLISGLIFYLWG